MGLGFRFKGIGFIKIGRGRNFYSIAIIRTIRAQICFQGYAKAPSVLGLAAAEEE